MVSTRHVLQGGEEVLSFAESIKKEKPSNDSTEDDENCIQPHKDADLVYRPLLERFKVLEDVITNGES